jgi:hypothetical protein
MSAIDQAAAAAKAPLGWAKARPFVFAIFVVLLMAVTIRYREKIAGWLSKIPGVGKWLTGVAAAAALVIWTSLAPPRVAVIVEPSAPLAASCHIQGYFHGHPMAAASSLLRSGALGGFLDVPARVRVGGAS